MVFIEFVMPISYEIFFNLLYKVSKKKKPNSGKTNQIGYKLRVISF